MNGALCPVDRPRAIWPGFWPEGASGQGYCGVTDFSIDAGQRFASRRPECGTVTQSSEWRR
jgi:hypothetical protein